MSIQIDANFPECPSVGFSEPDSNLPARRLIRLVKGFAAGGGRVRASSRESSSAGKLRDRS